MVASVDDRALGTSVRVVVTRPEGLARAKAAADSVLRKVDQACSRFRDDSELSRLNAAPGQDVQLSPLLATALAAGLRGARMTAGAVDPTVGGALRVLGYDADFETIPVESGPVPLSVSRVPGWQRIRFDHQSRTARIPRGAEIDLGATAKALAADLAAAAALDAAGGGGALVSLGGDVALAGEPPIGGWQIQIEEDSSTPIRSGADTISLSSGAIATSGTTVRRWMRGGVQMHHIIDPATGLPADGPWRTASVVAATCVEANIAATAAIVRGCAAVSWLEAAGLPARLVDTAGSTTSVAGWPAESPRTPGVSWGGQGAEG